MLASLGGGVLLVDTSWSLFPPSLLVVSNGWAQRPVQILPGFQFKLQTAHPSTLIAVRSQLLVLTQLHLGGKKIPMKCCKNIFWKGPYERCIATRHVKVMASSCGTLGFLCSCYLMLELNYLEGKSQQLKTVHAAISHLQFPGLTEVSFPKYFSKILGRKFWNLNSPQYFFLHSTRRGLLKGNGLVFSDIFLKVFSGVTRAGNNFIYSAWDCKQLEASSSRKDFEIFSTYSRREILKRL